MKQFDYFNLLKADLIDKYYSFLSLPEDWLSGLKELAEKIIIDKELKEYFKKMCLTFLNEEKPDFSEWEPPVVDGKKRDDFFLFLSLLAVQKILDLHSSLSIPMEITRETCLGVGTKSRDFFFFNKKPGTILRSIYWFKHHMEGRLFKVGRFEFMLKNTSEIHEKLLEKIGHEGWVLDMHIPGGGSMDLTTSYDSWKRGIEFFDRYFPDKKIKAVICVSWIFSPDLKDFLPPQSNLIKLQNEVEIYSADWSDMEGYNFIMGTTSKDISQWPENTSLQRAYKAHVLGGGKVRAGAMYINRDKILNS